MAAIPFAKKAKECPGLTRIKIDKIDTRVWELFRVPQPSEVIAKVEALHSSSPTNCQVRPEGQD